MSFWAALALAIVGATASICGPLIGGAIAGLFALLAVKKTHANTVRMQQQNQKKLIQAFLQAIHDEIETLWDEYQNQVGIQLEVLPEGNAFLFYYPITQDYF